MRLKMSEKKALTQAVCMRYRQAGKKQKTVILDEFVKSSGYNRKYALRMLNHYAKNTVLRFEGQTLELKAARPRRPANRKGKPLYGPHVTACLRRLWVFFWYKCGKYLAPLLRQQMSFLERSRNPNFHITPEIRLKLLKISPATIDRLLKADRQKLKVRGLSGTRSAQAGLLKQIPVRTHYSPSERLMPGYFQADTVHHCYDSDSGEFALTLTATDVASGWTELRALRNKAHKWTLEGLQDVCEKLPFRMLEIHSDNGSEFINRQSINWWKLVKTLDLSRSRPRHKNDNCFAEQKNNACVRNYVGYSRFDTEEELAALATVYQSLCPLLNFFIPSKKLISKTSAGSKTIKKYDSPKTPYQRLLNSESLSAEFKLALSARFALYNPVVLQQNLNVAIAALLALNKAKVTFSI
jgi:hypothetical protein